MLKLLSGDIETQLVSIDKNSVDALICDAAFAVGKEASRDEWIKYVTRILVFVSRVLKPGAHGLICSIAKRMHWTGKSIEDSGLEIRDCITHFFTGSKSEDKLKPDVEYWWLVRKPLMGDVALNVLMYGTGGINIDDSRVKSKECTDKSKDNHDYDANGRFPSNVMLSHHKDCKGRTENNAEVWRCHPNCAVKILDDQSDLLKENSGASKYFYCSKSGDEKGRSVEMMSYFINLITPVGGTVLDCFLSDGRVGLAAIGMGYNFIGIKNEEEFTCPMDTTVCEQCVHYEVDKLCCKISKPVAVGV
jgi:site-specific DNA-methyltransferase (adenine-specific)